MKTLINLVILSTFLLACQRNSVKNDIEGTYVTHFVNEYYVTDDTLVITVYSSPSSIFNVERRTGYGKSNDQTHSKKFIIKRDKALFDQRDNSLHTNITGRNFRYIPEKSLILLGDTEYHKVR